MGELSYDFSVLIKAVQSASDSARSAAIAAQAAASAAASILSVQVSPVPITGNLTVSNLPAIQPISGMVNATKSGVWAPNRPSQGSGRTYFSLNVSNATAAVDLLPHVPAGKVFYMTDFILTASNIGAAVAPFTIQNYTVVIMPILIGSRQSASAPAIFTLSHTFVEPAEFSINVFLNPGGSTSLNYSFVCFGYTE